jgi:hypothetical protein
MIIFILFIIIIPIPAACGLKRLKEIRRRASGMPGVVCLATAASARAGRPDIAPEDRSPFQVRRRLALTILGEESLHKSGLTGFPKNHPFF